MHKAVNRYLGFLSSDLFLRISLIWFIVQGLYFSIVIKYGIPPDENYHFIYIKFLSETLPSPFPLHQQGYDILLDAVHNPFFIYHYLFAFPYKLISGFSNAYILLRLLNVAMGIGSLLLLIKIADIAKISRLARNLTIFMLVNTLMFVFIFSAVSYDNLFILLSLGGVLILLKLLKKPSASLLLGFLAVLLSGLLTKINFLPFGFILFLIFAVRYYKKLGEVLASFRKTFAYSKKLNIFLSVLVGFLIILFVQRYVVNQVEYGSFNPACEKTRTLQQCRGSNLFVRNEMIYAPNHPIARENIVRYTKDWLPLIQDRTYGIFAHKDFAANLAVKAWTLLAFCVAILLLIIHRRKINPNIRLIILIAVFYSLVVFIENVHSYRNSGRLSFAVHGRYLFASLPLIYLVCNNAVLNSLKNSYAKFVYASLSIIIFFVSAFPVFLQKSTPVWYRENEKIINWFS